jgi:hypothetical protein
MNWPAMNWTAIAVGAAVAVGLGFWAWFGRGARTPSRSLRVGIVAVLAVAAGVGTHFLMLHLHERRWPSLDPEPTIAALKQTPLIRLVIADVPGTEELIRSALFEDVRYPVRHGPTRAFALMAKLRTDYIAPALKAADDKTALEAVAARAALLRHLQQRDLALCHEFAVQGLQRLDKLDADGQRLFQATLAAMEDAYRSGRGRPVRPALDDAAVRATLGEAGLGPLEFADLQRLGELGPAEACVLANRLNAAPTGVAADKAGPLARHLLTVQ